MESESASADEMAWRGEVRPDEAKQIQKMLMRHLLDRLVCLVPSPFS